MRVFTQGSGEGNARVCTQGSTRRVDVLLTGKDKSDSHGVKLPRRKAGPSNELEDEVNPDQ